MNINLSKKEILLVDDCPMNIKLLGAQLKEQYNVRFATSGEKALEIANSGNSPDLILLDIEMPGMNGYDVCKKLKENDATINIPIIFITGKTGEEDETKGLELGAVDYITKPFSLPIVNARIKTHLNLKHKSDILEKLTCVDGLTNIYNRRKLDEFLKQEWDRARRAQSVLSVILMDVDFFKNFNDNYGHSAGDDCLIRVAQVLDKTLVRNTDLVARYGGEEFIAVLPDTSIERAMELAEKIRVNVEELNIPHLFSQVSDKVTLSLGVATTIPTSCSDHTDLVKNADSALYKAKETGRNRVEGE
ncbi:MAG: PleD family two-component system response regulator [Nitrospinae bacterium]|nr:PleD family two-component system response regulator [Nitrospinota bacterium]